MRVRSTTIGVTGAPAAPCGPSYRGPVFGRYDYTIGNRHGYAVDRKLDLRAHVAGTKSC